MEACCCPNEAHNILDVAALLSVLMCPCAALQTPAVFKLGCEVHAMRTWVFADVVLHYVQFL